MYDDVSRLTGESVAQSGEVSKETLYTYDDASNRASKVEKENGSVVKDTTYTYNAANQLTTWSEENGADVLQRSAVLTYDTRGNRASTALTTHGTESSTATTTYTWTPQNMLSSVTLPGAGSSGDVHSYAYDYRVRRITRSEPGGNPVAMTFSGGLSVAEFEVLDAQLGTLNSQPSVEYQRGPDMGGGVGGLLYSLRSGSPKFNLSNGRGDVVAQSDSTGALTWTASYEAYGKRPVETGSNADRQRANTKEEDPTGLLDEGFRYRDLETGVWLSRDPAGFVDGPNLYAYVGQNPWTNFDPDGLLLRQCLPASLQWIIPPASGLAMVDAQLDSMNVAGKLAASNMVLNKSTPVKSAVEGAVLGATYHAMNSTGMWTYSEGKNKQALEVSRNGFEVRDMGPVESEVKTAIGFTQMCLTVAGFRTGGSPKVSAPEAAGGKPPPLPSPTATAASEAGVATAGKSASNPKHSTFEPGPFAGESIPARSAAQTFTTAERAAVNGIGRETGCHTCGSTNPGTKSGNFVPDHQPVSALNTNNGAQRLFPHCIDCSREQGLAVGRLLKNTNRTE